jgi:6-phosphogluconolactonase/glucosamine-6-phosphate isomerase/deaminase
VAVAEACQDIRRVVPTDGAGVPVLDMIFLGLGEDGHIASLMPNAPPACWRAVNLLSMSPIRPNRRPTA